MSIKQDRSPLPLSVAIRADASPEIGHGHVMRCLTLANAMARSGIESTFIFEELPHELAKRIENCGHDLISLEAQKRDCAEIIGELAPDWLIVDHYGIDQRQEAVWRQASAGMRVMVIDDLANRPHDCDLLLDIAPSRNAADYADLVPPGAKLCLGVQFALLAPDYAKARDKAHVRRKELTHPPHILVTLGGGDVAKEMKTVSDALAAVRETCVFSLTVLGSSDNSLFGRGHGDVEMLASTDDMVGEMLKADICIGAAGGTSWERCCLGLPTVVLQLAENQKDNVDALRESGAALVMPLDAVRLGTGVLHLLDDDAARHAMADKAFALCDGHGASRVRNELLATSMQLRDAVMEDARFIHDARYANNAARFYKSTDVPDFDAHCAWLERAIARNETKLLIVELKGEAIAHLRIDDIHGALQSEISIALAPSYRGQGYAGPALLSVCQRFFTLGGKKLIAEVNPENEASRLLFERAGFMKEKDKHNGFLRYVLHEAK